MLIPWICTASTTSGATELPPTPGAPATTLPYAVPPTLVHCKLCTWQMLQQPLLRAWSFAAAAAAAPSNHARPLLPPPSRRAFRAGDWVLTKSRPVPLEDDADDHSQGECK